MNIVKFLRATFFHRTPPVAASEGIFLNHQLWRLNLKIKEAMPRFCILLNASASCENWNWCCHIWSHYGTFLSRHHKEPVSMKIDGTTTQANFVVQYVWEEKRFTFILAPPSSLPNFLPSSFFILFHSYAIFN